MSDDIICSKCGSPNKPDTVFCGKCGTQFIHEKADEKADPLIGSFVGDRFLVHEKLGEGGMGVVYRAEQTAIQREVALKVLHTNLTQDESLYLRFQNEAAASSRLNHPNTITIYDFGKTGENSLYIAMEYIKGKSLDDEIRANGPIEVHRACHIAIQICGSLQDAHTNSIVHRDLKPENVMLCERSGEKDVVKVLDFGIAKIMEDDGTDQRKALTKTGMVFGTPQYMSPEQIRGEKVDHKTDIYSLGIILYQMLAGTLPFSADTPMGLLTKHLMDTPAPLDGLNVPKEVESIVMGTLEKDPANRPESMKALQDQLAAALGLTTGQMPQMGANTAPMPQTVTNNIASSQASTTGPYAPTKKKPVGLIVGGVVFLLAGIAAAWYFTVGPGGKTKPPSVPPGITTPPTTPPYPPKVANVGTQQLASPTPGIQAGTQPSTNVATPAPLPFNQGQLGDQTAEPDPPDKPSNGKKPGQHKKPGKDPAPTKPNPDPAKPNPDPAKPNPDPAKPDKPDPGAPQEDVSCKYTGGSSSTSDKSLRAYLKKRQRSLKACTKKAPEINSKFSFQIKKGAKYLSNIAPQLTPANDCVRNILATAKVKAPDEKLKGVAMFTIVRANDRVEKCTVYTRTISDSKVKIPDNLFKRKPGKKKEK